MLRNATSTELDQPLGKIFSELEAASDSLLIRENGQAVAALLTGVDYELYREWVSNRAWSMIEESRDQNAHLSSADIADLIDTCVEQVRTEPRASRAAS